MTAANLRIPPCNLCMFFVLVLSSTLQAQNNEKNSNGDEEQALVERWHKVYDEIIDSIQIAQSLPPNEGTNSSEKVELKRETILSISNPAFKGLHGRVYLWTDRGRPVILGSIKSANADEFPGNRRVRYAFNSLSQYPVTAGRNDKIYWNCEVPGVQWQSDLEASVPSSIRTIRLTQMRTIARDVNGEQLRLLTTPLYRYPEETPDVTDGAIFGLARSGTNPRIFLLIEARHNKWYLSCAMSNVEKLSLMKGTKLIGSFDYVADHNIFQTKPWYQMVNAEQRPSNDPNTILFEAWTRNGNR